MEKVMLSLWRPHDLSAEQWRSRLLGLSDALRSKGAQKIRVMVADAAVEKAAVQRITTSSAPLDGMLTCWLESASILPSVTAVLAPHTLSLHAYLVCESEPYPLERKARVERFQTQVPLGLRDPGMCQIALLHRPAHLSYEQWLHNWREGHGPKAYPLQSIFGYRQNLVVHALTPGAPTVDAIVEEQFPDMAIGNAEGFFDAIGNPALLEQRRVAMTDSVTQFIDFAKIDCIQTSSYLICH